MVSGVDHSTPRRQQGHGPPVDRFSTADRGIHGNGSDGASLVIEGEFDVFFFRASNTGRSRGPSQTYPSDSLH